MTPVRKLFEDINLWKRFKPDYTIREPQIQLAEKIYETIIQKSILVAEAGTGTGKTLAYLIAGILATENQDKKEKKIVISTETKTLQHQILKKDIPLLEKIFERKIHATLCLGSHNYICKRRLKKFFENHFLPENFPDFSYSNFFRWLETTPSGIIQEYPGEIPQEIQNEIVRIPELCWNVACPNYPSSFYFMEKEKWKKADILIVNHHLLATHIERNFSILPEFHILIIDEAHFFPDIYRENSILSLSSTELKKFLQKYHIPFSDSFKNFFEELKFYYKNRKDNDTRILSSLEFPSLFDFVNELEKIKEEFVLRQKQNAGLFQQNQTVMDPETIELQNTIAYLQQVIDIVNTLYSGPSYSSVHYMEEEPDNEIKVSIAKINVQEDIREKLLGKVESCIFTSATITVNKNFTFFMLKTGLDYLERNGIEIQKTIVSSPFDYRKQALLYIPETFPEPEQASFISSVAGEIKKLMELFRGRMLVIFTAKENLKKVYSYILENYSAFLEEFRIRIFTQEEGANQALGKFLNYDNAVLFGMDTYRQGIDIAGNKLQCVVLDKLPFPSPYEPVQKTINEKLSENGINYFYQYYLPEMMIRLKQGAGRLIRSEHDQGVIAILDSRIYKKEYGKRILEEFSRYKITGNFDDVKRWIQENSFL